MKCQSGGATIPALLTLLGNKCGWNQLPNFTRTVATLKEQPQKADDPVWQMGMHRHLREIEKISDVDSRLSRYQLLTDAWFADAMQFEAPFVLAVDAYEKTSTLFDQWFSQEFLVGVTHTTQMRVLVGGQTVPKMREEWSFCASLQDLQGVHEAKDWMAWAEETGFQVPSLEVMTGVVLALQGRPSQIIEVIQTRFSRSSGPIKSKASLFEQRKCFFNNMTQNFSLNELKNICFFLNIDYENLPDHNQKGAFVRELLAHAERVGQLKALVQACQAERKHLEW